MFKKNELVYSIILLFIFSFFLSLLLMNLIPLLIFGIFCFVMFIIYSFSPKTMLRKINHLDFSKEKEYFRDLIKFYSIGELSYLDGFRLRNPNDIIATLLKLERSNYIEIRDNKIYLLDCDDKNLKFSEKYILSHIQDGYLVLNDDLDYIYDVEDECERDGLIKKISLDDHFNRIDAEMKSTKRVNTIGVILLVLGTIGGYILSSYYGSSPASFLSHASTWIMIAMVDIGIIIIVICFIKKVISSFKYHGQIKVHFKLTEKGKSLYYKLYGLKNFLNDFSNLETEKSKGLFIWDDYLIYSVMFGFNKQIVNDYSKLIKIKSYVSDNDRFDDELN